MAQRTVVQLTDDLDGKPIPDGKGETIRFSLDRTDYEIDLTDKNAKALRDAFATYVSAARRSTGSGRSGGSGRRPKRPDRGRSGPGLRPEGGPRLGRSPRASRSASAAASRLTSSPSSRQPTPDCPSRRPAGLPSASPPPRRLTLIEPGAVGWTAPR